MRPFVLLAAILIATAARAEVRVTGLHVNQETFGSGYCFGDPSPEPELGKIFLDTLPPYADGTMSLMSSDCGTFEATAEADIDVLANQIVVDIGSATSTTIDENFRGGGRSSVNTELELTIDAATNVTIHGVGSSSVNGQVQSSCGVALRAPGTDPLAFEDTDPDYDETWEIQLGAGTYYLVTHCGTQSAIRDINGIVIGQGSVTTNATVTATFSDPVTVPTSTVSFSTVKSQFE